MNVKKIAFLNRILLWVVFSSFILLSVYLIFTRYIRNNFLREAKKTILYVTKQLETKRGEVKDVFVKEELGREISTVVEYLKVEKEFKLLVFQLENDRVIYPVYSGTVRITDYFGDDVFKSDFVGHFDSGGYEGYVFRYRALDLGFVAYVPKKLLYWDRNILLSIVGGMLFILILIMFIIELRRSKNDKLFLNSITEDLASAVKLTDGSFKLESVNLSYPDDEDKNNLIRIYNRTASKINSLISRYEKKIQELIKQRGNFRKLAYLYKKYSINPSVELVDEKYVEDFSEKKVVVAVLTLELVDFMKHLDEVYPEIISRELESFFRFTTSVMKERDGFVNINEGYRLELVFGLLGKRNLEHEGTGNFFRDAAHVAKSINRWVKDRNESKNITGVQWKVAMGLTVGSGVAGVIGNNLLIVGKVVDRSKVLEGYAKDFGVCCVTDSYRELKFSGFKYRLLDRIKEESEDQITELYELFLNDLETGSEVNIDDAIKLYEHGVEMYFEGRYDISASDFRKVNQLLGEDRPSLIFINRIERLNRGNKG